MSTLSEQVAALTKRLDTITGVVREDLVRRVGESVRFRLVSVAVGVATKYALNSDLRIGAQAVARAIETADLTDLVPSLKSLVEVEAQATAALVKQLADARAEVAALKSLAAEVLPVVEEWAEYQTGYGAFPGGDPRHFQPDEDGTTPEERAAWEAACAAAAADEANRGLPPAHAWVSIEEAQAELDAGNAEAATIGGAVAHVSRVMFGLGRYTSPEADALAARVRKAVTP